jgi:hypothetical protein
MIAATTIPINKPNANFFLTKAINNPMAIPTIAANAGDLLGLF